MEKRRAPRYRLEVPVLLHSEGQTLTGVTQSLSTAGAFVRTKARFPPEACVEIELLFQSLSLRTSVRVVYADGNGIALEFAERSKRFEGELRRRLNSTALETEQVA